MPGPPATIIAVGTQEYNIHILATDWQDLVPRLMFPLRIRVSKPACRKEFRDGRPQ